MWQPFQLLWLLLEARKLCVHLQPIYSSRQVQKKKEEWVTPNKLKCFYSGHGRSGYILRRFKASLQILTPNGFPIHSWEIWNLLSSMKRQSLESRQER